MDIPDYTRRGGGSIRGWRDGSFDNDSDIRYTSGMEHDSKLFFIFILLWLGRSAYSDGWPDSLRRCYSFCTMSLQPTGGPDFSIQKWNIIDLAP
jgi:hypothetical protein